MKTITLMMLSLSLLTLLLFTGCNIHEIPINGTINITPEYNCEELEFLFDETVTNFDIGDCMETPGLIPNLPVGATLNNYTYNYQPAYNTHGYILEFEGFNITKNIYVKENSENVSYNVGQFYEFNYGKICTYANSMASSGSFPGHNLLEQRICN